MRERRCEDTNRRHQRVLSFTPSLLLRMGKGLSFGRLLYDFSMWCTLVCLNKIVTSAKWMAVVFTIIFLAMCILFVFISTNCTLKFFKFPSSTELSIDMKSTPFPRFSFCNENPMKRSVVNTNGPYTAIATLLQQYDLIEQNKTTADDFGLTKTTSRLQRLHRAKVMLRLLMAKLSDSDRRAAGYSFTEMVSECTFAGVTCTSADFSSFLHPDYGVCFTFNGQRLITKAGKTEGLRIMMTVNQDSPLAGTFDFLPTTDSATIWAVIYDDADYPDFAKDGIRVGAQTQAFVALSKTDHSRMMNPYGNCSEDGSSSSEYYGNYTYTLQLCQHSCLQRLAGERCGCVDPLYRKLDNETLCTTPDQMLCLMSLTNDVAPANSPQGKTMCGCQPPCTDSVYQKTVTNSIFPSENYKVATGTQAQRGVLLDEQGGGREGGGSDDSDDYDATTTTRPITATVPITKVTTMKTTTSGDSPSTTTKHGDSPSTTTKHGDSPSTTTKHGDSPSTTTTFGHYPSDSPSTTTTMGHYPGSGDTTTTARMASSTSTTPSTTTTTAQSCPYQGPPESAEEALQSVDFCRSAYSVIYNDPNIIAIQGYPCTSTKQCKTCVMFAVPPANDQFICSYTYDFGCKEKTNTGYLPESAPSNIWSCDTFFGVFDFIPMGTKVPNISKWWEGSTPRFTSGCPVVTFYPNVNVDLDLDSCWADGVCKTKSTSADLTVNTDYPIPLNTTFRATINSTMTQCDMADLALNAATEYYKTSSTEVKGGGRSKRDTNATAPVDVPGFGSCEFANKNFKGSKECIEWYQRNGLMMHVYFETLEAQSYTQGATYPLVALISDISGHAGLWLGMSVVSVVELIALFFMCLNTLFRGRNIKLPSKDEIKKESEERESRRTKETGEIPTAQ